MNPRLTRIVSFLTGLFLAACNPQESGPAEHASKALDSNEEAQQADLPALPEEVTFNEHIQPILSEYCYHCHGPDEKTRLPEDAPLRIDLADRAFDPRENGKPVIIKGDPNASLLVQLLHSQDEDTIMPPPESHKELKPGQIALIEKWIDQGAEYQDHWSFIPIARPEIPDLAKDWARNPIDPFIAAKLAEKHLEPNPEEDPARLYRRLHFDLTGLPPTPQDLDTFLKSAKDDLQAAVEQEADRLLATTASAEHFARHWLDAARYADTHGIHIDNYRAIWPYRDWVIQAFEQNMPWDQFTIEQIGGDILPDATLDQVVATGFNRCLPTTGEGGAIAEEYDAIYAQDRTNTTSAVWLGLTVGCAACHDHKFDPITMKDTYSFNAFFRNTPMAALDRNQAEHPPNVFVPLADDRESHQRITSEIKQTEETLASRKKSARPDFDKWLASASLNTVRTQSAPAELQLPLTEADGPLHGTVAGEPRQWPATLERIESPLGSAPVVSGVPVDLGDLASFTRTEKVTFGGFIRIEGKPSGAVIARMDPDQAFRGWDIYLQSGQPASHVIESWPDKSNKIIAKKALKPATWQHVMVTFDGSKPSKDASAIYVDGVRADAVLDKNTVGDQIVTPVSLRIGARNKGAAKLSGGTVALQDFRFYRRLLSADEIKQITTGSLIEGIIATPASERTKPQLDTLYGHYLTSFDQPSIDLRKQLDELRAEDTAIRNRGSVSLVMQEKPDSEPFAHMLTRGVYSEKGEKVEANTPSSLPPMPTDAPRNRLGLAQWLVAPDNPLPARVTMNRLWHQIFGTGIVETVEDFGIMGARPSHPQLLDWLAAEFIGSGWDHRHMVKLIVSSAAYRQSGRVSPEKLEIDPANRLISRGPRYRLDAEQIRDLALAASDLLADKTGGPSVKPYQPEGVWEAVAMKGSNTRNYKQDKGESLYRRSLYTFWKRTAPHPSMEILNAPSREITCVRRERTNTPLQAFVTLNDPQFVEASRQLAAHAITSDPDPDARLDFITSRLISRSLADDERPLVRATLQTALESFEKDPDAAKAVVNTGETKPDPALPPAELAAWTIVTSQIFNLDEALTK